jgi:isopenicillin-N N-acyltransferase-like protein
MADLQVVDLPADPYEAGVAHGRTGQALIAENLRIYYDRFQREAKLTPGQVKERGEAYRRVIEREAPEYAEAMRGVSDGAEIPLVDVAILNARYEIMYSQYSAIGREEAASIPAGGCTAFAVQPEASADGHLWLGQNWDWIPRVRGLLIRQPRASGGALLAFTEAGIVGGKIGLNSHGIGLVINGLLSNQDDWARLGIPFHVRTWRILHAGTLDEAAAAATAEGRSCSGNFLIGRANGRAEVLDLETAPGASCVLHPQQGLLAHANHFEDPDVLGIWQPLMEEKTSTFHRGARMRDLLEAGRRGETLDGQGMMRILRDHDGRPDSVCRHQNLSWPEEWRVETVVSVLIDCTARQMYVASGIPCEHEFQRVDLTPPKEG